MKISISRLSAVAGLLTLLVPQLCADVGGNNPGGPAGIFNGQITTGGSYDPYTGNVMRNVPDITVAGGVGTYPLALSRTYNSRLGGGISFGFGGWRHSYEWQMDDSAQTVTANTVPSSYTVNFPDGRHQSFTTQTGWDPNYKRAALGTRERVKALNLSTMLVYLTLGDGGKVEFKATQNSEYDPDLRVTWYWYSYLAQAIIDPYGQRTSFTRDTYSRLTKVTEPAGRYLQFFYTTATGPTVSRVTASDGRTVWYYYTTFTYGGYSNSVLDNVQHFSSGTSYYTYQGPNVGPAYGAPLLKTCDDPTYPGPMKKIGYTYKTGLNVDGTSAVYGQLWKESYYDGTAIGAEVSELAITTATKRTETAATGKTRTFTYDTSGYLLSCTDFNGVSASQTYGGYKWITSVTDRNGKMTNFTRNTLTGVVTQIQYPLTQSDTPGQSTRPTVNYTYGSASCEDTNNKDATIPYYVCTATDEGGHVTKFSRDGSHRVTWIDYPDGSYEWFHYSTSFGQVIAHRMTTGGQETFTYGGRGLKTEYRSPANSSGNPTARYVYEAHDWLQDVTYVLGNSPGDPAHSTSYTYNLRGQVLTTTHPPDPSTRYSITNQYNTDGTLKNVTDELGHLTEYTYDDYKRVKTVKAPLRFTGDTTARTTYFYYDAWGTGDDYTHTNSQPTWITLPGGQRTRNIYDNNFRKLSTTVAYGTDPATTSYTYDNVGNQTSVIAPNQQDGQQYAGKSTVTSYDSRNRVQSITDALANTTSFQYDLAGRKYKVTRPNGQTITYDSYDEMNRLLQQSVTQTPEPNAITKWTYTDAGLVETMQDPRLVAQNSTDNYLYTYDTNGRKTGLRYPPAATGGALKWENWDYDNVGRLSTFTNRNGKIQTFSYDALHRMTGFSWDDGVTPSATFGYDAASRLIRADNANAEIDFAYFNDNLLQSENEHIVNGDWWGGAVSYTYDANGNRAGDLYPDGRDDRTYTYTDRNQLKTISEYGSWLVATYDYDVNGNIASRAASGGASSTYTYDELNRVTSITHAFNGTTRTFDYDYDAVGNRKWTKRDGGNGDAFAYDLADQVTAVKLDIANPDTAGAGSPTIVYDANGNRTSFAPYGTTQTYVPNNLNQYDSRTGNTASYDITGNMTTAFDASLYTHDAQNRVISATKNGTTVTFKYDALNRLVVRSFSDGRRYNNIWDGWNLILTYDGTNNWIVAPTHSPNGIEYEYNTTTHTTGMIYRDANGNTSHLANGGDGQLLEWYRYDLDGTPIIYDADNNPRTASAHDVRHLFTGQQWYSELGLYDLRNRFYSPDIGRFLQPDPIDFDGDATNLYRYCHNNPVNAADPLGLWTFQIGLSANIRVGWIAGNITGGLAFDGHGNIATFRTYGGGIGAGAQASGGLSLAGSTADTVYGLAKEYYNVSGGAGLGASGSAQGFWGTDPTNGKRVYGGGFTVGPGIGGGGSGGGSYTVVNRLWSPSPTATGSTPVNAGPTLTTSAMGPWINGTSYYWSGGGGLVVVATPIDFSPQMTGYSSYVDPVSTGRGIWWGTGGSNTFIVDFPGFDILPGGQLGVGTVSLPHEAIEPELIWNAARGWHYMARPGGGAGYSGPASSGAKKG